MKSLRSLLVAGLLSATALLPSTADSLREAATAKGLDWVIGNWGDKDTKGATLKISYEWRLDGHAIGVKVTAPDRNVEGLIARNAKTSEIGYIAIDNQGGGGIGKVVEKDGAIIVKISYSSGDGEEGKIALTHEKKDADTLKFIISELSDSGEVLSTKQEFELVRLK